MNKTDKEYDHLRSNQGRNQEFSRGTNIFLLSPPPPNLPPPPPPPQKPKYF